jgi:signal transduction histidine kinase
VLTELHAAANAPIFGLFGSQLGQGVVGGLVGSTSVLSQHAAAVAMRILRGESPGRITPQRVPSEYDWRELRRWNISENRLPPDSIVLFREPSLWKDYKPYILGGLTLLLLQTALIVGLLVHRTRLWRAEAHVRRSQGELRTSYERIRDLGGRLLRAQEDERAHIARELHDDIGQQVTMLVVEIEGFRPREPVRRSVDRQVDGTIDRLRGLAKSLHDLSHRLHPTMLQTIGLVAALHDLVRELSRPEFTITFTAHGVPTVLPPEITLSVFRAVQEALQNAVKHSRADRVSIELKGHPSGLALTIADNGIGFDVDDAYHKGLGLTSIRERLESIGGSVNIISRPGAGTHLEIGVPLRVAGTELRSQQAAG